MKNNSVKIDNIEKEQKKFFIAAGRLTKQKNFFYLINEFRKLSKERNDYNLLIFGDGEEKFKLNKLISKLNLQKRIFLMGHSEQLIVI